MLARRSYRIRRSADVVVVAAPIGTSDDADQRVRVATHVDAGDDAGLEGEIEDHPNLAALVSGGMGSLAQTTGRARARWPGSSTVAATRVPSPKRSLTSGADCPVNSAEGPGWT